MSTLKLATWNINSVRLRVDLVCDFLSKHGPDILCLQECKSPTALMPADRFGAIGYDYFIANGQKAYNGVAIISKVPLVETQRFDFADLGQARHIGARVLDRFDIHNFYVPAGGDIADRDLNVKFAQKLDYLCAMRDWSNSVRPKASVLVGDLNIAPRPDDVWNHKQLLKVVSHTPIEVEHLDAVMEAGDWVDITRKDIADGQLYSWWSYRARDWDSADKGRRLDHIWATADIANTLHSSVIFRDVRGWQQPSDHAPVMASIEV